VSATTAKKDTILARLTAVSLAKQQIGKPYSYGAEGPSAFDCSGLVQYVMSAVGISIPRTAADQFNTGTPVSASQLQPGDAVFFKGADGTATSPGHEALYIGDGKVVVAPHTGSTVQVESLASLSAADTFVGARRFGGDASSSGGGSSLTSDITGAITGTGAAAQAIGSHIPVIGPAIAGIGAAASGADTVTKLLTWMVENPKRLLEVFAGGDMLLVGVILMFRITTQTETVQSVGGAASSAASLAASPVKAIGKAAI
jgi:hypothetical protein